MIAFGRFEDGTICCYAVQDKVWVTGPGGERWEVYTVLADAGPELEGMTHTQDGTATTAASGGGWLLRRLTGLKASNTSTLDSTTH